MRASDNQGESPHERCSTVLSSPLVDSSKTELLISTQLYTVKEMKVGVWSGEHDETSVAAIDVVHAPQDIYGKEETVHRLPANCASALT